VGISRSSPMAGLPELVSGTHALPARCERARHNGSSVVVIEDGINMIGGCCRHRSRAHRSARSRYASAHRPGSPPGPCRGSASGLGPSVASLYGQVPLRAGERLPVPSASVATPTARASSANCRSRAIGTAASKWGASRSRKGLAHARSVHRLCRARRWSPTSPRRVTRMRGACQRPAGHRLDRISGSRSRAEALGGKPIINSINFEDGEEAADKR